MSNTCIDPNGRQHEHCPNHGCVEYVCCVPTPVKMDKCKCTVESHLYCEFHASIISKINRDRHHSGYSPRIELSHLYSVPNGHPPLVDVSAYHNA